MSTHKKASYTDLVTLPLMTLQEVAESLGVSPSTVRRLVASGELQSVRIGGSIRVRPAELDDLVGRGAEAASVER